MLSLALAFGGNLQALPSNLIFDDTADGASPVHRARRVVEELR